MSAHITLAVANVERLVHGCQAHHCFDQRAGTLGSRDCDWHLQDRANGIKPLHCEVRWHEGTFCIIARAGCLYVNGAEQSLAFGIWVRLAPDDSLKMGDLQLNVQIGGSHLAGHGRQWRHYSLNGLLSEQQCPLQALARPVHTPVTDPTHPHELQDPLAALEACVLQAKPACAITRLLDSNIREHSLCRLAQEAS